MKLLVAGADQIDAGKTTFSTGLLGRIGGVGYKPRAGNGYWYDHDDYRRAVDDGRLYGKDARRLAAASAADVTPEEINPVHRLWTPAPGRGTGLLGREDRAFVVDRIGSDDPAFVVNDRVEPPRSARERLPLADATHAGTVEELNRVMERLHRPALDALAERVARADRAVIESYSDVARPLSGFEPDAVAVVDPGRARVFDGRRYARACEVAGGSAREGQLEVLVERVVDLLDPLARVDLPALPADHRTSPGAVADAYERAYDELLSAAE